MNELQQFNFEGLNVRTLMIENEPFFVGKDVAEALGYVKARNAIASHVEEEDKKDAPFQGTLGGKQNMTFINESGVYSLIFRSKLDSAKRFKYWVTSEVLPSIRKNGMYATDDLLNNPDLLIATATRLKDEMQKRKMLEVENQSLKPKAVFADAVAASHTSILVGELAKLLKQNGIQMGQNKLFGWLRENGYLIKRKGTDYNMPTQRSMEQQLFEIKETSIAHSDGHTSINKTPKVTGKGQQYFINKFLAVEA